MKKKRLISKTYCCLVILRCILMLLPQFGYIHPDEFFQNVEILGGRIFEFETSVPWEFNTTAPIRSIGPSLITIGTAYHILRLINTFVESQFKFSLLTPYCLLIAPRILMCMLSFLIDYALYLICTQNNEKSVSRLTILASSYVPLVYGTRTFTNTLETILFAVLLYFVADSMIFSNIVVRQREYLNKRFDRADNPADRAKVHKLRLFLVSDSYRNCLAISLTTVVGFFNRPTFLCYALFPIFFWLYRGIGSKSVNALQFNVRIFCLALCAIPPMLFFIVVDSFFYGYLTWGEIGMLDVSINNFVFPPWNFIKYNIASSNLAKHGLHPRWLHIFVNIPLLFNVLGILSIFGGIDLIYKLFSRKLHLLPSVRSVKSLMIMAHIAPTCFLSFFPHQEPRFLLPIVLPLVYLYSPKIDKEPEWEMNQDETCEDSQNSHWTKSAKYKDKMMNNTRENKKETSRRSTRLYKMWFALNMILTIFYGFLHQGGVLQAAEYLCREMHAKPQFDYHIVTSHIYSIPHIFYMQPNNKRLFERDNIKYRINKHIFTYEEGSKDLMELLKQMETIIDGISEGKKRYRMFLLMSGSKHDLITHWTQNPTKRLEIRYIQSFFPHVSTEALPLSSFNELVHLATATNLGELNLTRLSSCTSDIFYSFDLKLYEIHKVSTKENIIVI